MSPSKSGRSYTFDQFTAIRRYQLTLALSPDGSEAAYSTNISGQYNIWRQTTDGGFQHQVTIYSEQAVRIVDWSPDGQRLAYMADRHGDEFHQIYVVPAQGGMPEQLTDEPQVQHYLSDVESSWSPDGRYLAYAGNDREPTDMDLLLRDMQTGEVRRMMYGGAFYAPVAWSPDGRMLCVLELKSNTDMDVHLLNMEDGSSVNLTKHEGDDIKYVPTSWAADGSGFYLLSDEGREFTGLAFYDLSSRSLRWVETPEWDVELATASPDGRYLAWVVNEDGYSRLYVRDLQSGADVAHDVPSGVIAVLRFSHSGGKLGIMLARAEHPTEIYVLDLAAGKATQLTHSMLGGIDEADLIQPEIVRYTTHDSRQIPAFLYRPREGEGKRPVILSIHGGPEAQERPAYLYSGAYQYWLSLGIGVLATNIRGSSGYGKSYQKLIHHDWGGAELRDLEEAVKYLRTLDWVDPDRIGVFGGSFGGFATLSCVSRLPDYWAAAVDIVGPSNLVTFAKAVPPTWRRFMAKWVGDAETEVDFLMSRSPITYVDKIKTPLFVIQGAKDPRVVKGESDQMVEKLRARGVDVKYDVYEDEGHGFTKRANELKAWRDASEFLGQYLLR